jgi:hypothetical protein
MLTPTSPVEQLFFTTLRVHCIVPGGESSGTLFLAMVRIDQGDQVVVGVTNKHVIDGASAIGLVGPAASPDGDRPLFGSSSTIVAPPAAWVRHPDPKIDVTAAVLTGLPLTGASQPFLKTIPVDLLATTQQFDKLDAIESVTFIGYPNALFDSANMTPIARRGWTATPVSLDYGGMPMFLIDASVFRGSSGSPVFIVNTGSYSPKNGGLTVGTRIFLLGILARVYSQEMSGTITVAATPRVEVQQYMNLGIVYKTRAILETIDALLTTRGQRRALVPSTRADSLTPVDLPQGAMPAPPAANSA